MPKSCGFAFSFVYIGGSYLLLSLRGLEFDCNFMRKEPPLIIERIVRKGLAKAARLSQAQDDST
jgi:hypothetical protein